MSQSNKKWENYISKRVTEERNVLIIQRKTSNSISNLRGHEGEGETNVHLPKFTSLIIHKVVNVQSH